MAKAVNCENGPAEEPCNSCSACRRITEGSVMDVLEIDAASNRGVEEIRDIREKVKYAPAEVRQKVYIIDEVHMLTTEAFNALLKTLEEPPAHAMFILATTEPHKLPATIISRCQRFDFRRVPLEEQVARLSLICEAENVKAEKPALDYIARLSDGGMRDALSILDQVIAYTGDTVTLPDVVSITGGIGIEQFGQLAAAVANRDAGAALSVIDRLMQEGKSAEKCMENLLYYFRDALMLKLVPNAETLTDRVIDAGAFKELVASFTSEHIFYIIDVLSHYQAEMKYASQPQTIFEVSVLKLCSSSLPGSSKERSPEPEQANRASELAALRRKVDELEQKIEQLMRNGAPGAAAEGKEPERRFSAPAGKPLPRAGLKKTVKLDRFLPAADSALTKQFVAQWGHVLQSVKERKIYVHAWLVNGEPVSVTDEAVLVAFKSAMHRETTEKPAHRELIEQVILEQTGKPLKLATCMVNEWKDALAVAKEQPEEMQLETPDTHENGDDLVAEAVRLFGDDLVVVKE